MRIALASQRRAVRNKVEVRVPLPVRNTVQGGAHAVLKARLGGQTWRAMMSDLAIQERHLVLNTYDMGVNQARANTIQNILMNLIAAADGMRLAGTCNEGGIGAFFYRHGEMGAWQMLAHAVEDAQKAAGSGYELGEDVFFGVDGAADRYYIGHGVYELDGVNFDVAQLMDYYARMVTEYPIIYAEDLFASRPETQDHWAEFNRRFGSRLFVIGDDIATTNARLVRPQIEAGLYNMLLLKMNQVGTMLEGWRAAETAHKAGLMTVSSHRSTSGYDFMEVEVALALSMMRENMGRCIMAKWGGAKLIERAARYAMAQQWVEDWESEAALSDPVSLDARIVLFKAYPAPLNTGDLTVGIRVKLSTGHEINVVVPAGTSTGETEAALVPYDQAVKYANDLADAMGLRGMRIGDLPGQIDFTHRLLGMELREAMRQGNLARGADPLEFQVAAEMKRVFGANTHLALTCAFNRLTALAGGIPSWLSFRQAGEELTRRGMTFDDEAFYGPVIRAAMETHIEPA